MSNDQIVSQTTASRQPTPTEVARGLIAAIGYCKAPRIVVEDRQGNFRMLVLTKGETVTLQGILEGAARD